MSSKAKQQFIDDIQKKIGVFGVNVDNVQFELDEQTKKQHPDITEEEFFENLDESEKNRMVEKIMSEVAGRAKQTIIVTQTDDDCVNAFVKNPTENNLLLVKKMFERNVKQRFKEAQQSKEEGHDVDLPYTNEDLTKVLKSFELGYNFDLIMLKIRSEANKIYYNIPQNTQKFLRDLKEFEEGIDELETQFHYFQAICKTIDEFENKMAEFEKQYILAHDCKPIAEQDKQLFKDKKELEKQYKESLDAHKKIGAYFKKAVEENKKIIDREKENKRTNIHLYYDLIPTLFERDDVNGDASRQQSEKIIFEDRERAFQKACGRQLRAKQHLRDVTQKIYNYKVVSRKSEEAERKQAN